MSLDPEITTSTNSEFVKEVLQRTIKIFASGQIGTEDANVYTALKQAKDDFLAQEPKNKRAKRTYGFTQMSVDLGNFIWQRYPKHSEGPAPINEWSSDADQETVVKVLQEAVIIISDAVAERTRNAPLSEFMSQKERGECLAMHKAKSFLQQQGLTVEVDWEREDPRTAPIDYRATVNGTRWAIEITELRKDAKGSHRTVGDPKPHKTLHQELQELSAPIPKVEDGPEALKATLNKAVEHGNQPAKLEALNGAKYCLLIHNQQFLYEPSWLEIPYPDRGAVDVVLIIHIDDLTSTKVWEVIPNDGFGQAIKSQNISDLADIADFKASSREFLSSKAVGAKSDMVPEMDETEILQAIDDL